ncbi:WD40 repeat-like protein [Ganoderma leucocontextum]|nr:WD40 repeat-like protein [Ganoderma leucocontextum]
MSNKEPWELYAETMFNHFGYPLWHADPEVDESFGRREVELGSVGYLDRGKFRHLFNARKAANDPFNDGRVPATFEVFNTKNTNVTEPEAILRQPYVASGSVRQVVVAMEGSAASPVPNLVSAGGSLSFECKQNTGAVLLLDQAALGQSIPTKRHIVTYLYRHMDNWFEWATDVSEGLGHDLQMHDIKFVSGTLKTTKWACATFSGSYRNKTGSMIVSAVGVGDLDLNVSIEDQIIPHEFYNTGPSSRTSVGTTPRPSGSDDHLLPAGGDVARASTPLPPGCDQCIFFHYFSLKKRLPRGVEAGAGPHGELWPEDPDMQANSPAFAVAGFAREYDIGELPSSDATEGGKFDPVVTLLDYMLAKTDAEYAIASDRDVLAIFGAAGVPDDIMAGLEAIDPPVEVDENNVATVTVDMTWLDQQTVAQAAVPSAEVSGSSSGPEHVEDAPGVLGEHQAEQPTGDASQGEEGEGADNSQSRQAVWDPAVVAHTGSVTSLAVSPDSQWVASGSADTTIILWEVETQSVVRKWESHGDIVWHLAFSPDSLRLASSGGEGRIMVWDVDTGEHLATMEGHTETIHTVLWSPDGTKLASGSDDGSVRIWDGETYECLHLLEGHNAMVTFVLFSHNGQYLASGGADYNCRIWDEDNRIATASDDGSVRIWKVETGEELVMVHEHHGPVWAVSFSPGDGKQILSGSSDSTLKICDSFTGERVVSLEGHDSMINSATFSPDGRFVASASSDNTVRLWRRSDGTSLKTFNEHNKKVTHSLFSPDGETLSSGSDDGTVRIRVLRDFVSLA